jgi:uncharacterized membrane protein (Fun14 family)
VTIGVFVLLLGYMSFENAVSFNFEELSATLQGFFEMLAPLGLATLFSSTPFIGSFVLGLVFGLRRN